MKLANFMTRSRVVVKSQVRFWSGEFSFISFCGHLFLLYFINISVSEVNNNNVIDVQEEHDAFDTDTPNCKCLLCVLFCAM